MNSPEQAKSDSPCNIVPSPSADLYSSDNSFEKDVSITKSKILLGKKYKYRLEEMIGQGAYAKVYNCTRQDGKVFAIKIFDTIDESEDAETIYYTKITTQRELEILKQLKHPSIIGFEESVISIGTICLVLEKMDMTLLNVSIDRSRGRPSPVEIAATAIFVQILNALSYMHSLLMIHRDVKPENILITPSTNGGFIAKLSDFGSTSNYFAVKREKERAHASIM